MSLVRGGALETQDVDLAFTISVGQATIVKPLATATFCAPFAVLGDHAAAEALAPKFFAGGGIERIVYPDSLKVRENSLRFVAGRIPMEA